MGISTKTLQDERTTLKKTFDEIQSKLQMIEKETTAYRNNLNAVGGAIQQIDKLIVLAKGDKKEKKTMPPEKEKALNIATS